MIGRFAVIQLRRQGTVGRGSVRCRRCSIWRSAMTAELYRWLLVVFAGWIFCAGIAKASTDEKVLESSAVAYTTSMNVLNDSRTLKVGDRLSVRILEDKNPPFC